jgi:hypothetical protein
MSITLKFFMIKRGFTHEKLVSKADAQTADDVLRYVRGLGVAPTANDVAELEAFFATKTRVLEAPTEVFEEAAPTPAAAAQVKTKRKKKASNV